MTGQVSQDGCPLDAFSSQVVRYWPLYHVFMGVSSSGKLPYIHVNIMAEHTVVWIKIPLQSLINVKRRPTRARCVAGRLHEGINLRSTADRPDHKPNRSKTETKWKVNQRDDPSMFPTPARGFIPFISNPPPPPHPRQLSAMQKPHIKVDFTSTTSVLPLTWRPQITGSLSSVIIFWDREH